MAIVALAGAWASGVSVAGAEPVPEKPSTNQIPEFTGSAWTPQPVSLLDAPTPPRHPFMAPNDRSNLHDDAYQTDTANWPGPLGRDTGRLSFSNAGVCGSITFDSRDRLVTVCVGAVRPVLKLLDPVSLKELANLDLPPRQSCPPTSSRTSPAAATSTSAIEIGRSSPRRRATSSSSGRPRRPASESSTTTTCRARWPPTTRSSPRSPTGRGGSGSPPPGAWWARSPRAAEP